MPTYTAVAGGGNWNSAATWTGGTPGAFPTTGDTAILNATSGQVTVTANATCLILNCTGYANTLTINTGFSINVSGTGATISLGGTISTLQQGVLSTISGTTAVTINFNGVTIPRLSCGFNAGALTQTVTINGTNPTVQNLTISNGAAVGSTSLANNALTITSSLNLTNGTTTGLGGVAFNIGGGGIVDITTNNTRIGSGFTVLAGTTLRMQSTLLISGGTITFNTGSFLTHNNYTLSFATASTTLNSPSINWYNVLYEPGGNSTSLTLLSDLNISNNLTTNITTVNSIIGSGGTRNINIQGNFSLQSGGAQLTMTNTIVNLLGTGLWECAAGYSIVNTTININGTGLYTIGSATRNDFTLNNTTVKLVGTSTATVLANNTLRAVNCTLETNNTSTGANIIGGSEIVWFSLQVGQNAALTLTHETKFSGNLTTAGGAFNEVNGQKLLLRGNLAPLNSNILRGTSTIELYDSNTVNWNTAGFSCSFQNNIVINKAGGAVNLLGTINWGATGRTLLLSSGSSTINPGTSTVTIPASISVTISNMTFGNLTIGAGATIIQNQLNTINLSLLLSGSTTFAGTHGFTTNGFNCTTASAVITLQNADATYGSPLAAYNVTGPLILQGTSTTTRITLQASGRAEFTGAIALASPPTLSAMTTTSPTLGTIRIGMTVSGRSGLIPAGLQPFITDRPVISSGSGLNWFINKTLIANPVPAGTSLSAGFKAIFNLTSTGTNVNVGLVTTQDIDSSGGQTILAALSNGDDTATNTALYRTLNWGPLIAPSGSVYYTWVD